MVVQIIGYGIQKSYYVIITTFFNGVEDFILFFILNQRQIIMNPLAWSSRVLWAHLINIYEKYIYNLFISNWKKIKTLKTSCLFKMFHLKETLQRLKLLAYKLFYRLIEVKLERDTIFNVHRITLFHSTPNRISKNANG